MWICCCCCRNTRDPNLDESLQSGEDVVIYEATILDVAKLPDKTLPAKFDPGSSIASESIAEEEELDSNSSNSSTFSRQTIIYVSNNFDDFRAESTLSLPNGVGLNFDEQIDCNNIFTAAEGRHPQYQGSTSMAEQELLTLVKRLEAVALKLEASSAGGASTSALLSKVASLSASGLNAGALAELGRAVEAIEAAGMRNGTAATSSSSGPSAKSVTAFDEILNGPFKAYMDLSKRIGAEVATISEMVETAFKAQRAYLEMSTKAKQPSQGDLPMLLKPMSDKISEIQAFREAGRRCQYFNHLSAISESIPALGWVAVSPAPGPFVKEMNDAGQFYTNRVLKDWKDKSKSHVEWTKAWLQTLTELQAYVKEFHTTGLVWNPKGVDAKSIANHGVPPAPAAGGPPPPPPPPPADLFDDIKVTENAEDKARNALFSELNKGEDVTKGLKKVTDDMKTHKNPNLRGGSVVPASTKAPSPEKKVVSQAPAKPPKLELEGKKWAVEYFKNNPGLIIENTETNQSVYVYKCEGSTLKIEGKVNNIVVDGCKKTAIVFDNAVSSCEFINCQSVQMQVLGKVPTISIDKTDGCQMFLSKESLNTEIISAKSSEMNVMIPDGDEFVEQPVPEQFKTVINGVKLATSVTESV